MFLETKNISLARDTNSWERDSRPNLCAQDALAVARKHRAKEIKIF